MSKDFFKRKETKAPELSLHNGYDLNLSKDDMGACGITDTSGFETRFDEMLEVVGDSISKETSVLESEPDSEIRNIVGICCQVIESHFTKRELSFLMSKSILSDIIKQAREENKKEE